METEEKHKNIEAPPPTAEDYTNDGSGCMAISLEILGALFILGGILLGAMCAEVFPQDKSGAFIIGGIPVAIGIGAFWLGTAIAKKRKGAAMTDRGDQKE